MSRTVTVHQGGPPPIRKGRRPDGRITRVLDAARAQPGTTFNIRIESPHTLNNDAHHIRTGQHTAVKRGEVWRVEARGTTAKARADERRIYVTLISWVNRGPDNHG